MESHLPLFILLAGLMLVVWQILLDFTPPSDPSNKPEYRGLNAVYHKVYVAEITGGRMPDTLGQHVIDVFYRHRFGWLLLVPSGLVFVFLFWVTPWVLDNIGIDKHSLSAGTIVVAVLSLPIITFVWFIRAYERDRELTREEANLWSGEFDRLMKSAASGENEVLQRAAIRQLQDYLSGAKWRTNQRSNSTAVFELFSSVLDGYQERLEEDIVTQKRQKPIILTIGAVLRSVFGDQWGGLSRVRASQNSLANLHFDLLDLTGINLSQLNITHSTFMYAILTGANLKEANLSEAKLFMAGAYGANMSKARLYKADLSKAILIEADMSSANLVRANLSDANLLSADLSSAFLGGANLSRATLIDANLTATRLNGGNLVNADLTDANLTKANLTRANLAGSNLTDVNLSGTNLEGTGLEKEETLKKFPTIKYDAETKWDTHNDTRKKVGSGK